MRNRRAPGVIPGSLHAGRAGRANVCDASVTVEAWPCRDLARVHGLGDVAGHDRVLGLEGARVVALVRLLHDVVLVDLGREPVRAGLDVGDVDPLEREVAPVDVAPPGRDAHRDRRGRRLVLEAEVGRCRVDLARGAVGLAALAVLEAEAHLQARRHLGRPRRVPQRVAGHLPEVPVVVAVLGLVADRGLVAGDRRQRLQAPAGAARVLSHEGHVGAGAAAAAHLERTGAPVVHEAVEAQEQRVGAVRVGVLGQLGPLGGVGDEVGEVEARPRERADDREGDRGAGRRGDHGEQRSRAPAARLALRHGASI